MVVMNDNTVKVVKDNDPCASLAHDLRAPLMSVKGLLNLMKKNPSPENFETYFELVERSIDKMEDAISDLLERMSERQESPPEQVDIRQIAEEAIQSLQYMPGAEMVDIDLTAEETTDFVSDRVALFSIFSNIISNAIRYRDRNRKSFLKIDVSLDPQFAKLLFEDNGIGISDEDQAKVFDRFYRVSREQKGSGLGLAIVKSSVEKLGGTVEMRSRLGIGTAFLIYIPNVLV